MRRRWLIVFWLVVWVMGWGISSAGAWQDVDQARAKVQQWLLQKLGKPGLLLVEYTYEGTSWPDSSMGCPVEGQTPIPGLVNGYRWTFLFDNMVRYEVHSNLDGSQAVLCAALNAAPDVKLTTYTTTTFTTLVPEAWLVFPNSDQTTVLFAPQQQMMCDQPGMRVSVLGRVASDVTPDQVIDDGLAQVGAQEMPDDRITVGTFGRSALAQTPCELTTRQWRISGFVQYGIAYRVEQWAPQSEFDQWAQLYLNILSQFGSSDLASAGGGAGSTPTPTGGTPAAPAALAPLPLAHLFVGDIFLGALNDIPGRSVTNVPAVERRYLSFSPDGLYLSFIDVTNAQVRVLNVAEWISPRTLAESVDPSFPPAWRSDSQAIAFVASTGTADSGGAALLEIHAVPLSGGDPQTLGTFAFSDTCPVTYSDPADQAYFEETGPFGQETVLIWLSDAQFLISTRCDSGLGLLNLADGRITDLGSDLHGGALSPDRTRFLARTGGGLAILDLNTGTRTDLPGGAGARQLAWGPDGQTIYYSTEVLADNTTLDDPADQARAEAIFGYWPVNVVVYTVSLVSVNLATNQETVIWQGQGRGIGRIDPAPDGSGVLFSLVSSSLLVAEVFQAGADPLSVREAWPGPVLYWLPAGGTAATLLAYSGQPVFAPILVTPPPAS